MNGKVEGLNEDIIKDDFLMSPKIDFVFKLIFGEEKNKRILQAFLSTLLRIDKKELEDIKLLNTELLKKFKEDKKGILDVRVETKDGKHIDIEIQVLPSKHMAERSLFYWGKMYTGQISPGDTYDKLQKCIAINIVNFEHIPLNKIHTKFHILEYDTGYKLTDALEIHFLELPKLEKIEEIKDIDDPSLDWLRFINAESREEIEVLVKTNNDIKDAYEILQEISQSKEKRQAYEARQAEIMDQMTREKAAKEEGVDISIQIFKYLKENKGVEEIVKLTGVSKEKVEAIKNLTM